MDAEFDGNDQISQSKFNQDELTELFKGLTIQKLKSANDFSIERELSDANASEDDIIAYAISLIHSTDTIQQTTGACIIRRLLSREANIPCLKIINSNIIPHLIQLIPNNDEMFALEVLGIISNIASGDQSCTAYVISIRCLELFNALLPTPNWDIFNQIMGSIGNISGESTVYRDLILDQINFQPVIHHISQIDFSTQKYATLVGSISNLIRSKPKPSIDKIKDFCPFLAKALLISNDSDVLIDALGSYSYITDSPNPSEFLSEDLLTKVISLFDNGNLSISVPALRIFGNYTTGIIDYAIIERTGVLHKLFQMLEHRRSTVRRETYGTLSNLFADNSMPVQEAINSGFFEKFMRTLDNDIIEVKKEAFWAVNNTSLTCTPSQAIGIVENRVLDIMLPYLTFRNDIANIICEGFLNFLNRDQIFGTDKISEYMLLISSMQLNIVADQNYLCNVIERLKVLAKNPGLCR